MLVKLATNPELFAEMQSAFPGPVPSDEILRSWLLRKGFLQSTVDLPIRAYRETMELAQAQRSIYTDVVAAVGVKEPPKQDEPPLKEPPEVGDLIQWEASGVLRLESPRRVRAKTQHEGAWWVFVDGSETGIPMDEAVVIERKAADPQSPKLPPTMAMPQGLAAVPTASGEREWLRGPLSKDASYRLIVSGEMGAREIGKLIKLLQAQQLVLDDES